MIHFRRFRHPVLSLQYRSHGTICAEPAGFGQKRLPSHDSDFDNLYLAGDWTFTDLNIGCIEAAVISARMASRAICGRPQHIYGAFGG